MSENNTNKICKEIIDEKIESITETSIKLGISDYRRGYLDALYNIKEELE